MKNHFENIFIRELLDSEFVFAKTRNKTSNLNFTGAKINFKKSSEFHILDIFELNTSLKQLVRILFSLKYSKTVLKSEFIIYIWCLNPFILDLANSFIKEYNLFNNVLTINHFPSISYTNDTRKKKHLFVFGDPWAQQPKNLLDSYIINNGIFLVSTLNFKWERYEPGFYKIKNDLSDYKKLLVLLVIIESIINKKKEKIGRYVIIKKALTKKKIEGVKKNFKTSNVATKNKKKF